MFLNSWLTAEWKGGKNSNRKEASEVRGSQSRPLEPTDWTFWEILSYFTIGAGYIMVKTLISPISNIKVKGEIKPHKNTSMDKKIRPMLRKGT